MIKVVSLAVGLTVGLVLIAKVQLEMNYDCCIVDKERVYELQETFQRKGEAKQQLGLRREVLRPYWLVKYLRYKVPRATQGSSARRS